MSNLGDALLASVYVRHSERPAVQDLVGSAGLEDVGVERGEDAYEEKRRLYFELENI